MVCGLQQCRFGNPSALPGLEFRVRIRFEIPSAVPGLGFRVRIRFESPSEVPGRGPDGRERMYGSSHDEGICIFWQLYMV